MTLPDDQDQFNGVRATAERAWRMTNRNNWIAKTVRRANGEEVEGHEFQLTAEETTLLEAGRASSTAGMSETSTRWQLQKALSEPAASTPAIVADGIRWAKERAERLSTARRGRWRRSIRPRMARTRRRDGRRSRRSRLRGRRSPRCHRMVRAHSRPAATVKQMTSPPERASRYIQTAPRLRRSAISGLPARSKPGGA